MNRPDAVAAAISRLMNAQHHLQLLQGVQPEAVEDPALQDNEQRVAERGRSSHEQAAQDAVSDALDALRDGWPMLFSAPVGSPSGAGPGADAGASGAAAASATGTDAGSPPA